MKLLRELVRLRAAGRGLFSVRRDAHRQSYAVTVPPPLSGAGALDRRVPEVVAGHLAREPVSARLSSSRNLCGVSSR